MLIFYVYNKQYPMDCVYLVIVLNLKSFNLFILLKTHSNYSKLFFDGDAL